MIFSTILGLALLSSAPSLVQVAVPRGNPGEWITTADYPQISLRNDEEGAVEVEMDVASDGKPSGCSIKKSSGYSALDNKTCELMMQRGRFLPMKSDGNAEKTGRYRIPVRWVIPEAPDIIEKFGAMESVAILTIDNEQITSCRNHFVGSGSELALCEEAGSEKSLQHAVGDIWRSKKEVRVGLYAITDESNVLDQTSNFPFRKIFFRADMSISADGSVKECVKKIGIGRFRNLDICEIFQTDKQYFEENTDGKDRSMVMIFDIRAK